MHTSFQLYHARLPKEYLRAVHDDGELTPDMERVELSVTRLYDFRDPVERGDWLDILIALIEYLRSGTSYVGSLNNRIEKNMIHKDPVTGEEVTSIKDFTIPEGQVDASEDTSSIGGSQIGGSQMLIGDSQFSRRSQRITSKRGLEIAKQEGNNKRRKRR